MQLCLWLIDKHVDVQLDLFAFSTFPSDKHSAPSAIPADYYASLVRSVS